MDSFLQDLRYSLRKLVRAPAFTIVAVFTLALAIGATTAVFSLVDGVLLKSLPFRDPDRLVRVQSLNGQTPSSVSQPDFLDYRAQSHTVSPMAAFAMASANLTAAGAEPMRVQLARVGAVWFDLLGVRPQLGRAFRDDEEKAGAARVAVLSQSIWRSRFGGDPKVLGTSIDIDGKPVTVVGVAPAGWNFPEQADIWSPLVFEGWEAQPDNRGGHWLRLVGRLAPHVAVEQTGRELAKIADGLAKQYPATNTRYSAGVTPLLEALVGPVRPALLALLGAVVFVLLIACANVANLMLVRAGAREGEIAVRMALGAGSWRLARQLVIESVMLSLVAAALGAVLASWAVDAVVAFGPKGIPRLDLVAVDGRALAFGIAIASVTGLLFGLVPALHAARPDVAQVRPATPGFFPALGIRLLRGRLFDDGDRAGQRKVLVVSEEFVRRTFPGEDPLGKTINLGWGLTDDAGESFTAGGEIVGVVADVRQFGPALDAPPIAYLPFSQAPVETLTALIRSSAEPAAVQRAAREAMRELDADLPLYRLSTMDQARAGAVDQPRFYAMLLGAFAALALFLAAVGIYGVISYSVSQRTRELGIRLALGATARAVLGLVLQHGLLLAGAGIALGLVASFALTRVLRSLLFGVGVLDPLTLATVCGVLAGAAVLACWLPARRAARVDPLVAMKAE